MFQDKVKGREQKREGKRKRTSVLLTLVAVIALALIGTETLVLSPSSRQLRFVMGTSTNNKDGTSTSTVSTIGLYVALGKFGG